MAPSSGSRTWPSTLSSRFRATSTLGELGPVHRRRSGRLDRRTERRLRHGYLRRPRLRGAADQEFPVSTGSGTSRSRRIRWRLPLYSGKAVCMATRSSDGDDLSDSASATRPGARQSAARTWCSRTIRAARERRSLDATTLDFWDSSLACATTVTTTQSVMVTASAARWARTVTEACYSFDGEAWTYWETYSASRAVTLPGLTAPRPCTRSSRRQR